MAPRPDGQPGFLRDSLPPCLRPAPLRTLPGSEQGNSAASRRQPDSSTLGTRARQSRRQSAARGLWRFLASRPVC
jgi:hypothetical protein